MTIPIRQRGVGILSNGIRRNSTIQPSGSSSSTSTSIDSRKRLEVMKTLYYKHGLEALTLIDKVLHLSETSEYSSDPFVKRMWSYGWIRGMPRLVSYIEGNQKWQQVCRNISLSLVKWTQQDFHDGYDALVDYLKVNPSFVHRKDAS
jgi:hypothetical protein